LKFSQQIGNKYYFYYPQNGFKREIVTGIENLQKIYKPLIFKISFTDKMGKNIEGYIPREYLANLSTME